MDDLRPIRRYKRGDKLTVQAQQIWLILVSFVSSPLRGPRNDNTITYGELARLMGKPGGQRSLSRQLAWIAHYCEQNDLPCLNTIVVNQETGIPGSGVIKRHRSVKNDIKEVMSFNWLSVGVPSVATFRKIASKGAKKHAEEIDHLCI